MHKNKTNISYKNSKDRFIIFIITFVLAFIALFFLQRLTMPKFVNEVPEGSLIEEYYADSHENDIIFVGDCEAYESFVPEFLEEKYGIRSFIRGSASERIWQSYYIMKETLKYEKPKTFVLSIQALSHDKPAREEYNRMTFDGMKWSCEKLDAILASVNEKEKLSEYIFPILRYHSRITELKTEDFKYIFKKPVVSERGYLKNTDVKPVKNLPKPKLLSDYTFSEKSMKYLKLITELCKKNNIQLILIKAPVLYPYWYEEWDRQVEDYAKENNLMYINFLKENEKTGIDYTTDTYDAGLHLNFNGAVKLTDYMGKLLTEPLKEH